MFTINIHDPENLDTLADDWNRLAARNPFRRFEWLGSWWKSFATSGWELFVVVVRHEAGQVVLIAPWFVEPSVTQGRVIKFLGSNVVCTDHLSLLVDPIHEAAAVEALAHWLSESAVQPSSASEPSRVWDSIDLTALDADDGPSLRIATLLEHCGNAVERSAGMNCWVIPVPLRWDDYLAQLSKSHRYLARRLVKDYVSTGRAELRWSEDHETLTQSWGILIDLHQRRRQMLGQPGCFSDPAFAGFLHSASLRLWEQGLMRLAVLRLDGCPAGVKLMFQDGDRLCDYNGGIEPNLLAVEPGRLMNLMLLQEAMREGLRYFDLLRGDEPYKAHARAQPQPTWNVRIVSHNTLSSWRHTVWSTGIQFKNWLKSRLGLTSGE